jgi:hypothetical protein
MNTRLAPLLHVAIHDALNSIPETGGEEPVAYAWSSAGKAEMVGPGMP